MKIGYRTLKTAIGASLTIYLTQWFGLLFAATAGVLTMLAIQPTKKRSLHNAYTRITCCFIGLLFGLFFFKVLGFHVYSFFLMILLLVPMLVKMKIQEGFTNAAVIILHLYTVKTITPKFALNEIYIILIGVGVGLLMNGYMPSMEKELKQYQQQIEQYFKIIMQEMAVYLRKHESLWSGREILDSADLLQKAKELAFRNKENHIFENKDYYVRYFQMRQEQFLLLERIIPLLSTLPSSVAQGQKIADFLDHLSEHIHPGNTAVHYLRELHDMLNEIKQNDLPKTREEFETRATLFYFLHEMERYLLIKKEFQPAEKHTATKVQEVKNEK